MPRAVKPINVRPKLRLLIARILHDAPNGTVLVGHNRSSEARNRISALSCEQLVEGSSPFSRRRRQVLPSWRRSI